MKNGKIIYIMLIISILLPFFSYAQISIELVEKKTPGILAGWWNSIKTFFSKSWDIFINAVIKAWYGTLALWNKIWTWIKNFWISFISSKIDLIADKVKTKFK